MLDIGTSEARDRVLDTAQRLFSERGYAAVTLRDIARELGMRQASLYYHAPGGKEELFVLATERSMARHKRGMEAAIATAGPELRAQIKAAAHWLLSQPPMDWSRMMRTDMPAIAPEHAARLTNAAYEALLQPIAESLARSEYAGHLSPAQLNVFPGTFIAAISALHDVNYIVSIRKEDLADQIVDMLLDGIRPRE
ncbi:MAG: TetR/AcrR family transcriptional regulator [Anaerolineae bacterium]